MPGTWAFVSHDDSALGAAFVSTLARALSRRDLRVLVFDLCPSYPAQDIAFDVSDRVVYTLSDTERMTPEAVFLSPVSEGTGGELLLVPVFPGEDVREADVLSCIAAARADVVLIHAEGALLDLARRISDGAVLMTRSDAPSLRAAERLAAAFAFDAFLLTDFVPVNSQLRRELSLTEMADMLSLPLFGILPRADVKNSLYPADKDFRVAVENMAGRLSGQSVPLLDGILLAAMRKKIYFERTSR